MLYQVNKADVKYPNPNGQTRRLKNAKPLDMISQDWQGFAKVRVIDGLCFNEKWILM